MRMTIADMRKQLEERDIVIAELRAQLDKGRACYKEVQTKLCQQIARGNRSAAAAKRTSKPAYVAPSVPKAELDRREAARARMAAAKKQAADSGKSVAA